MDPHAWRPSGPTHLRWAQAFLACSWVPVAGRPWQVAGPGLVPSVWGLHGAWPPASSAQGAWPAVRILHPAHLPPGPFLGTGRTARARCAWQGARAVLQNVVIQQLPSIPAQTLVPGEQQRRGDTLDPVGGARGWGRPWVGEQAERRPWPQPGMWEWGGGGWLGGEGRQELGRPR